MAKEKDTHELVVEFFDFTKRQMTRHEALLEKVTIDIRDMHAGQEVLERDVSEMKAELRGVARAIDSDSQTLIGLKKRVARLEKSR
jgi:hypothetical protein